MYPVYNQSLLVRRTTGTVRTSTTRTLTVALLQVQYVRRTVRVYCTVGLYRRIRNGWLLQHFAHALLASGLLVHAVQLYCTYQYGRTQYCTITVRRTCTLPRTVIVIS